MSSDEATLMAPGPKPALGWFAGVYLLLPLIVLLLAVTSHSYWIDETYTAEIARQPTFHDCWARLLRQNSTDLQMPLYSSWIWACEKAVGAGEFALRAVNLFWFATALWLCAGVMRRHRPMQFAIFLVAAFSPFAWYYLNEARSYTMQLSTSLLLYGIIYHWARRVGEDVAKDRWWVLGFIATLVCLCGSSLLGMLLAITPLLMTLVLLPRSRLYELVVAHRSFWAVAVLLLSGLGCFYLWTVHIGARATAVGATDWRNPLFIAYELFGFGGLGPGRLEIRNGGLQVFKTHAWELALYGGMVALFVITAFRYLLQQLGITRLSGLVLSVALPAGFILAVGAAAHFRVLGRHCAALWPVACFILALGITRVWQRGKAGKAIVIGFFAWYLFSSLSLRFAARHAKDDYRSAAAIARTALQQGRVVWWNADPCAADYYQVPTSTRKSLPGRARQIANPRAGELQEARPPDIVITSKPDIYDGTGMLQEYLRANPFHISTNLTAFTIWERSGESLPSGKP